MTHSDRPIAPKFAKVPDGTEVMMARKKLVFGQTICQLEDDNHLIGDISALRQQIDSAGYLLLRGFFDPALVSKARTEILNITARTEGLDKPLFMDYCSWEISLYWLPNGKIKCCFGFYKNLLTSRKQMHFGK